MNIINNTTVTVSTSDELKEVLEGDNSYEYIYLDSDITLESGITINANKSSVVINGTYLNTLHTLTGMNSEQSIDTIVTTVSTKEIKLINIIIVNADDDVFFEYNLPATIADGTSVELTANVAGSFIYGTRTVTTPFTGELTLLEANPTIDFSFKPINNTLIFPKVSELKTKIVDSRLSSPDWKLYAYIDKPPTSTGGYVLENALVFKKFDDSIIILTTTPVVVYTGTNNGGIVSFKDLNWSTEKGPLLDLTDDALEANEEYFATIYFNIEE